MLDVLQLLMERSPPEAKLIAACWFHDRELVADLRAQHPDIVDKFSDTDRNEIAHAVRNSDTQAALLMLKAGLPVTVRGQHRGTPLHWAAWHGNFDLVQALLRHGPALEDTDNDFQSTPLGWATHGSQNGWHRETGDYPAVVQTLLEAGAKLPETVSGTDAVKDVIRGHGDKGRTD